MPSKEKDRDNFIVIEELSPQYTVQTTFQPQNRYYPRIPIKPFVKWAGGKGQLLPYIRRAYPKGFGTEITRYAEPFIGGGAVLCDVLSNFSLDEIFISDINAELINTYTCIRDNCTSLIEILDDWERTYLAASPELRKEIFSAQRDRYNSLKMNDRQDSILLAALFIFLNKTCFNGLYRVNRKGFFNVPIGAYKKPKTCDEANLRNLSKVLQPVTILCGDYRCSESFIDEHTFVYFDPPYRPITTTSNFTSYTEMEFDDNAQNELAEYVRVLDAKGAKVLISNSDPKNADPNDTFFDELYAGLCIERISANRMINSNSALRGKVTELLISNY